MTWIDYKNQQPMANIIGYITYSVTGSRKRARGSKGANRCEVCQGAPGSEYSSHLPTMMLSALCAEVTSPIFLHSKRFANEPSPFWGFLRLLETDFPFFSLVFSPGCCPRAGEKPCEVFGSPDVLTPLVQELFSTGVTRCVIKQSD